MGNKLSSFSIILLSYKFHVVNLQVFINIS